LIFRGIGTERASDAWQRAVATWSSLRWSELRAGRSGAAHGRALAYRRADPRSGRCAILEVTEYGAAYAGSTSRCDGAGDAEPGRYAWLNDALWQQLSPWLEQWGVYEDTTGVYFFGKGNRPLRTDDVTGLLDWIERASAHVRSDTADIVQREGRE